MKKVTPKELLTKENCKRDLLMKPMPIRAWIIMGILLFFEAGLIVLLLKYAPPLERIYGVSMSGVLVVSLAIAFPVDEYLRRKKNRRIREGKFHIEEAVLAGIVENAYHHRPSRHDSGRRDRLDFPGPRSFFLDVETGRRRGLFTYYKWSSLYYMTSEGILHTSQLGDTFYLLVYDDDPDRKPIMVYNAKFFAYDEYKFYEES